MFNKFNKKKELKPYLSYDLGGYKYDFYYSEGNLNDTYLEVTEKSMRMWSIRIPGNTDIFGMLLLCAMEISKEGGVAGSSSDVEASTERTILERYGLLMHLCSVALFSNEEFTHDFLEDVSKYINRLEEKSKEIAESITEEDENISQHIMEAMIRPHDSEDFKAAVSEELDKMLKEETKPNVEEEETKPNVEEND